jgi:hypothetical protein
MIVISAVITRTSTGPIRDTYEPSASRRHTSSLRPVLTRTSRSAPVPAADDSGCGGEVAVGQHDHPAAQPAEQLVGAAGLADRSGPNTASTTVRVPQASSASRRTIG